ncbi:MAG: helix-turn-helix domain-containing protein [Candidatus Berkelbacteria bacterium]
MKYFDTSKDIEPLIALGLERIEVLVYLSSVELGKATFSEIARNAGVERTAVYYYVDRLISKKLLLSIEQGKRTLYQPADPSVFESILANKKQELSSILPKIDEQYNRVTSQTITEYYRGIDEITKFYDRLYQLFAELKPPLNKVLIFGNSYKTVSESNPILKQFVRPAEKLDVNILAILPKSQRGKTPEEHIRNPYIVERFNLPPANLKYMPNKEEFPAPIVIFNNLFVLFDYKNSNMSIHENKNIADSWRAVFYFIWDHLK